MFSSITKASPFAILIGVVLGLAAPGAVSGATVSYDVFVHPGGSENYLNCGWHGKCLTQAAGYAQWQFVAGSGLDLESDASDQSEFRSRNFRDDILTNGTVGTGTVTNTTNDCTEVSVVVKDNTGMSRGTIRFVHQENADSNFILQGKATGTWETHDVSTTTSTGDEICTITGDHLHQVNAGGFAQQAANYPTATWGDAEAGPMDLTSQSSDAMYYRGWSLQ